ncbi:ARM repeat-containing protein [Atractiella rhizophila]|nr:ARM repeat-containing protein [Atractiella rhizophila]
MPSTKVDPAEKSEKRRDAFKARKAFTSENLRRKHGEKDVQIRKQRREETLSKRRNLDLADADSDMETEDTIDSLPLIVPSLNSNDPQIHSLAALRVRKLLSRERSPPIDMVINSGIVPRLIYLLTCSPIPDVQQQAAWALTNIASGNQWHVAALCQNGLVPLLVDIIGSPSAAPELKEQCIWCIGNIAGDGPSSRDQVLSNGAMRPLLNWLSNYEHIPLTAVRNGVWCLSNLCRGKAPWSTVRDCLPFMYPFVNHPDLEVVTDALWTVSYLVDGPDAVIQSIIDAAIVPKLIDCLSHPAPQVHAPALRALGSIASGSESQTRFLLESNVVPPAHRLLVTTPREAIRKEVGWMMSNLVVCEDVDWVERVVDEGIFEPLIEIMRYAEYRTKKECAWAISNASAAGLQRPNIIHTLVKGDCLQPFCEMLPYADAKTLLVMLDGLDNILRIGESEKVVLGYNMYARIVDECGGRRTLEELQDHENVDIYHKTAQLLDHFFTDEDDMMVQETGIDIQTDQHGQFAFNQ